jgi:hypothetical protein
MAVDVNQTGSVRLFVDQMVLPNLVVEGARNHNGDPVSRLMGDEFS